MVQRIWLEPGVPRIKLTSLELVLIAFIAALSPQSERMKSEFQPKGAFIIYEHGSRVKLIGD